MSTRNMTLTAMLTALLCIAGPMTLAIGPIPLSLASAVLMLAALLLGAGRAALCCGLYLFIGLLGLPVFSGFSGGAGQLFGPTGGFLLGYLPMTALCGCLCQRTEHPLLQTLSFICGTLLLYALGTAWYCWQSGVSTAGALPICVLPFLPGDAIKIAFALLVGRTLKRRLKKANLL